MFQGTVPVDLRAIVAQHARLWPVGADVYVGCSGNLTLERMLYSTVGERGFALHGNDITGYSCALGWYFAGEPVPFALREESREALGWLEGSLDGAAGTVATLMLGTRFLQFVNKPGLYYQRMVNAYRTQWPSVFPKTKAKVEAVTMRLASFYAGDVRDMIASIPPDAPVLMFPPFYGSSDYETMFAAIDTHFDWPVPQYRDLDEAGKDELIEAVTDRPHWLLGLHLTREELPLRGVVQTTNRGVPIHVYSSGGPQRLVRPRQLTEAVPMRKIGPEDEVAGELVLHELRMGQFATLRSQFMSKTIKPGTPALATAVSVGGLLVGAFAVSKDNYNPDGLYLLSDFPVSWSRYPRLSKLIVMAALSVESGQLAQRVMARRITTASTTAFSDNPNSAKYGRGIPGFALKSRIEPATDGVHRYQLQYAGPVGQWTLPEAMALWKAKHSRTVAS